jgi:hypothetical protein
LVPNGSSSTVGPRNSTFLYPPQQREIAKGDRAAVIGTSPDGKYQITRGKELVIEGSGTTPIVLQQNLDGSSDKEVKEIVWSPANDKVLITTSGEEGTNFINIAWLEGRVWKSSLAPISGEEPRHYVGCIGKVLGWISDETFEMTNVILTNGREKLPMMRYKVKLLAAARWW